jgi:phosphate starvation-inducible PhoH-like protein
MISILKALELLKNPNNEFYQIILCTPAVEADEKLGYLKGSLQEKMEPYIYSSIYLFEKALGKNRVKSLLEREYIKVIPLAFMRGINIDNAIVIAEEFQNATPRQVKTLLTRIGTDSKFIISGDLEQSDRYKDTKETGLYDALQRLSDIEEVGTYRFSEADIVRNKVISKILDKYK